jgi:hypothetical protein
MEVRKPPAVPDPQQDYRNFASVLAFLEQDSPEREAMLKKIGLQKNALSTRLCSAYARSVLAVLDSDQPGRMYGRRWEETRRDEMALEPNSNSEPIQLLFKKGLITRRLCEVQEHEVDWLWWQRIPKGKLSLINGDPDLGKTWLILDVMARITTGRPLPDGTPNPFNGLRRDVLWASAEDDDEDTVKPRFRMLDGDMTRFHSLQFVRVIEDGKNGRREVERTLKLSEDLDRLGLFLETHPLIVMVGLDPLAAFLGKIDSHRNADVRALLTPLKGLAAEYHVAVVGNNHLSKGDGDNAMYRGMGSIAFVAAARSSWLVTKDPKQPKDRRLFTEIKGNNRSENISGLAFHVGPDWKGISWEENSRVQITADEALRSTGDSRAPQLAEAMEWLQEVLKDGPVPADDVLGQAKADGICINTLRSAKKKLGVRTRKSGGPGEPWMWFLPKQKAKTS